jgi:hypothetical protein
VVVVQWELYALKLETGDTKMVINAGRWSLSGGGPWLIALSFYRNIALSLYRKIACENCSSDEGLTEFSLLYFSLNVE